MFKIKFFYFIFIFLFLSSVSKSDVNIIVSVDEKIITNYDIQNEANYLKF